MNISKILSTGIFVLMMGAGILTLHPFAAHASLTDTLTGGDEFKKALSATGETQTNEHPALLIKRIIDVALTFMGIIIVCLFLWAGYLYMTAAGDSDKVQDAQKIMIYAAIGALIIISSWGLTFWVFKKITDDIVRPAAVESAN